MNDSERTDSAHCQQCGAPLISGKLVCWLCLSPTARQIGGPTNSVRSAAPARRRSATQFTLASLMLIVTLTAVLMGIWRMYPGVGIALSVFALPALVRTWVVSLRTEEPGESSSTWDRIRVFLLSMAGFAVVIPVAGMVLVMACLVALFVVCTTQTGGSSQPAPGVNVAVGIIFALGLAVAGFVGFALYRVLFHHHGR